MSITIYTDGSCCYPGYPGGWAAISVFDDKHYLVAGYADVASNNSMEITAGLEGLKQAICLKADEVVLVTDSSYLINGLNKINQLAEQNFIKEGKPIANKDLWINLFEVSTCFKSIECRHIKGHVGHPYNELCDVLANVVSESGEELEHEFDNFAELTTFAKKVEADLK